MKLVRGPSTEKGVVKNGNLIGWALLKKGMRKRKREGGPTCARKPGGKPILFHPAGGTIWISVARGRLVGKTQPGKEKKGREQVCRNAIPGDGCR